MVSEVLRCLLEGLRWRWGADAVRVAGKSGISQARTRLGEAQIFPNGAGLVAEPTLTRVIDEVKLNAGDFYLDKHATIFTAAHDLYAASKPVDELSVAESLTRGTRVVVTGRLKQLAEPA